MFGVSDVEGPVIPRRKKFAHELFVEVDMIDLIRGHAFIPTKERISELTSSTSYHLSAEGFNRPLPRQLHNDHEKVGLEFRNVLFFFQLWKIGTVYTGKSQATHPQALRRVDPKAKAKCGLLS